MLAALETLFLPALRTALGGDADLRGGPATAPAAGQPARLSLWAERLPHARRVVQDDWITPTRAAWVGSLTRQILAAPGPVVAPDAPATTPESASTEPTDRSMPPVMITHVAATPR